MRWLLVTFICDDIKHNGFTDEKGFTAEVVRNK